MVTTHEDWSERVAAWLPGLVEREIPLLGICYGHQLLAYAMGGEVGDNPNGLEFGTVEVQLEEEAARDLLLTGFGTSIRVHLSHTQSVLRLPERAQRLASSGMDRNQAYVIGNAAWGVQFHPEFDADIVRAYIAQFKEQLHKEGKNPQQLAANCTDTPVGPQILRRFRAIVEERERSIVTALPAG
jgi:GMP synthase (glutamine-hydrolysing)